MTNLQKVVLVSGSTSGIGKAIAARFTYDGFTVIQNSRNKIDQEDVLGAKFIEGDVTNYKNCLDIVKSVKEEYGRLDVLVASAAATKFASLNHTQRHHLERTLSAVVLSYHQMVLRMIPLLGDAARIVAISGLDARFAQAGHGALGAAKAALESLTRSWAVELAPRGCTVNAVLPGAINTESLELYFRDDQVAREAMVKGTPLGRLGLGTEVADVVAFLCSTAASFMTGQVLVLDGGASAEGGGWSQFRDLWNT